MLYFTVWYLIRIWSIRVSDHQTGIILWAFGKYVDTFWASKISCYNYRRRWPWTSGWLVSFLSLYLFTFLSSKPFLISSLVLLKLHCSHIINFWGIYYFLPCIIMCIYVYLLSYIIESVFYSHPLVFEHIKHQYIYFKNSLSIDLDPASGSLCISILLLYYFY